MQYNDNSEMKGDYKVDARGTSELLAKDQMVQMLIPIMKMREDPVFAGMVDWEKGLKQLLSAQNLDIMKSSDEIKQWKKKESEKKPEPDPRIKGNIDVATIRAEGDMQKLEAQIAADKEDRQFKAQMSERDNQQEVQLKNMDYQIKMMEYAAKRDISLDKVKADLAAAAQKLNVQVKLAKSDAKGPQITTPAVEPAGRAKEGRAFPD